MKKNYTSIWIMLILVFVAGKYSYAQNAFIDYQTWVAPNPSPCNIFAPAQLINGYSNQTSVGQPGYSQIDDAVTLDCQTVGTAKKGTEYQIVYPFKKGFSYRVKIIAATIISIPGSYPSLLRTQITNQSLVGISGCVGMGAINMDLAGPNKISFGLSLNSFTEMIYDFMEQSSASGYLRIGAVPQPGGSFQTMFIRSVRIEETAVNPDLTLSPSHVVTTCGTDLSQTFTVSNPYNVTGITSYEWDLGSATNGWKYNGTAAPRFISTAGNTLSLTADGCRATALSNVAVTVNKNSIAYKTYSATTYTGQPTLSIAGPDRICSGSGSYEIAALPCNAQVTWSVQFGSSTSLGCTTCPQTSLAFVTDGTTTLVASIQLPCNPTPIVVQKVIATGAANPLAGITYSTNDGVFQEPFMRLLGSSIYVGLPALANYTNYNWSIRGDSDPSFTFTEFSGYNFQAAFNSPVSPQVTGTILFNLTHPQCGTYTKKLTFYINPGEGLRVMASPVPANNILNVTLTDASGQLAPARKSAAPSSFVSRIQVVDKMGSVKIDKKIQMKLTTVSVDVSTLINDIYILKVFDGKKWWSKQITIQR